MEWLMWRFSYLDCPLLLVSLNKSIYRVSHLILFSVEEGSYAEPNLSLPKSLYKCKYKNQGSARPLLILPVQYQIKGLTCLLQMVVRQIFLPIWWCHDGTDFVITLAMIGMHCSKLH